ncbi:MAG: DUF5820 family protein [Haloarculaceae archaeon]
MSLDALPVGWRVWNEEPGKIVLAYRPDVFDGSAYPAPCLPTIYVTRGRRSRRPGGERVGERWHVTLYLEPEVSRDGDAHPDREAAIEGAVDLATRFDAGAVDYRALYQVPRPEYLDRLDELTGRGS